MNPVYNEDTKKYEVYGTYDDKIESILRNSFNEMNINIDTWMNYNRVFDGVRDFTNVENGGKVQILSLLDHSVIAAGYVEINCQYEKTTGILAWKKTEIVNETYYMIVICDGWENGYANQYSSREDKNRAYSYISADLYIDFAIGMHVF